jgi:hypothetical protein
MSKLTNIDQNNQALGFARNMILRLHGDGQMFSAGDSRAFFRSILQGALVTAEGRLMLVEYALAGEAEAQALLRSLILEAVSTGRELPVEVGYYKMILIRDGVAPVHWGGPKAADAYTRDIAIAMTVSAVCDKFALKPTGRSARKRSGCAIVAEALDAIGLRMSASNVETIWKKLGRSMPTVKGWSDGIPHKNSALP